MTDINPPTKHPHRTFEMTFEEYEWKSEELYGACHACGDDEALRVEPDAESNPCEVCGENAVMGYETLMILQLIDWQED